MMKKFWNRAVSWLLAATMTLSLVPTTALAARWDEETPETPATDDRVVDTQRKEDGEQPENPDGPDDPVNPDWDDLVINAEINTDGTWTVNIEANSHLNASLGQWVLALVPNLKADGCVYTPKGLYVEGSLSDGIQNTTNMESVLGDTGLTEAHWFVTGGTGIRLSATDGSYTFSSDNYKELPTFDELTPLLDGFVDQYGNPVDLNAGIPFYVVLTTAQGATGLAPVEATMTPPGLLQCEDVTIKYSLPNEEETGTWAKKEKDGTYTDMSTDWGYGTIYLEITNSNKSTAGSFLREPESGMPMVTVGGLMGQAGLDFGVFSFAATEVDPAGTINATVDLSGLVGAGLEGTSPISVPYYYGTLANSKMLKFNIILEVEGGWKTTDISLTAAEGYGEEAKVRVPFTWGGSEAVFGSFDTLASTGMGEKPASEIAHPTAQFFLYETDTSTDVLDPDTADVVLSEGTTIYVEFVPPAGIAAGTYEGDFIITEGNGAMGKFHLTFTVTPNENFTVTYDPNGGNWGGDTTPKTQTGMPGTNLALPDPAPTRTGYKFNGWWTDADNTKGTQVTAADTIPTGGATYYAHWAENIGQVNVYLGTTKSDTPGVPTLVKDGITVTHTSTPSAGTYVFNELEAGTYDIVIGGATVGTLAVVEGGTKNKNVYYHTYTYNANVPSGAGTATGMPSNGMVLRGTQIDYPTEPKLTGYSFGGWRVGSADSTTIWDSGKQTISQNTQFYAVWEGNTATVTVKKDAGNYTGYTGALSLRADGESTITGAQNATNKYIFTFGTLKAGVTYHIYVGDVDTGETVATVEGDDAKGTVQYYTVTYKYHDEIPTNDDTDIVLKNKTGTFPNYPTWAGHTANGWYTAATGGTKAGDGGDATPAITATTVYHLQWATQTRTITYDWGTVTPDGETLPGTAGVVTVNYGAEHTVSPVLTKNDVYETAAGLGWTFLGWEQDDTDKTMRDPGYKFTSVTENITLTAKWEKKMFRVTYADPNSHAASGMPDPLYEDVQQGATHTLAGDPTGKTGYTFNGWYNGTTKVTADFKVTEDVTLNAHWLVKVTYVTGYPGSETVATPAAVDVPEGETTVLPTLSATDYGFQGWAKPDSTTANAGDPGDNYTADAPITLTGVWVKNPGTAKIKVTKDGSAYSGVTVMLYSGTTASGKSGTSAANGTISIAGVPEGDYNLYVTIDGTATDTGVDIHVPAGGNSEEKEVKYWTVTYKDTAAHHTGSLPSVATVLDGKQHTVAAAPTAATGYKFDAWNDGTADHDPGDKLAISKQTELEAKWTRKQSTVEFEMGTNGGTFKTGTGGGAQSQTGPTGEAIAMPLTPELANFHFVGWNQTSGATTGVTSGINFPADEGVTDTYHPIWDYTITYHVNWGSNVGTAPNTPASVTKVKGTTQATAPNLTPDYYTLEGWYTNEACTEGKVAVGDPIPEGTKDLYAKWVRKQAKITVQFSVDGAQDTWPTGWDEISVTGPDGATWKAKSTDKQKEYILDRGASYTVTDGHYSRTVTAAEFGDEGVIVNIPYYTMKAQTKGSGTVEVKYDETHKAETTDAADNEASIVVPYHADVTWTANPNPNYGVKKWGTSSATLANDTSKTKTESNVEAGKTKVVEFGKEAFDTYLVVNVNGDPATKQGGASDNIKAITLVTTNNGTTQVKDTAGNSITVSYDSSKKVWKASGVANTAANNQPYWRVETFDDGVHYLAASVEDKTADATDAQKTKTMNLYGVATAAKSAMEKNRAVMTAGSAAAKSRVLVELNDTITALTVDPADGYTHSGWTVTGQAAGETVNFGAKTFALTAAVEDDVVLTPTFTFETTIETRHKTATGTLTNVNANGVVLYPTGTTTGGKTGVKQTADGTYKVTGLDPATTYDIWINGFKVGLGNKQVTSANANGKVPVIVFKVTVTDSDSGNGTTGRAVGLNSASGTAAIVPNGAAVTTDAPTVKVTATAKTPDYRKRTTAVDGAGKPYWTADAGTVVAADVDKDTAGWTIASMTDDVVLTANVVRQYKVTAVKAAATAASTVTPTVQTGVGSAVSGENAVRIDGTNGVAKITVTKDDDEEIVSWGIVGGDGKLYTDAACTTELKAADYQTTTVAYAKSSADATVTVTFGERHYNITVHTLKNKGVNYPNVKVKLGADGTEQTTNSSGIATFSVTKGEYEAYANGTSANLATGALVATGEKATVNATTNADGATITIQYYDVNLVTNDLSVTPNAAGGGKVLFGTGTPTAATDSIILQAKPTTTNSTAVKAAANDAANAHYRIDSWSADVGTAPSGAASSGNYTLPAKTDTGLAAHEGAITVTVNFMKQYKVTVAKDTVSVPATIGVQVKKTGDASYVAGDYVLVDAGSSADAHVNGTIPAGKYFKDWTVTSGSGKFNAAKTDKGYEETADNVFYPEADSTIMLYLWTDAGINPASATYDKGSGTNTWDNTVKFTIRDAKDVTETFAFTGVSGTAVTPVLGTDYTKTTAGGVITYTFDTDFLKTLKTTTHTLTIDYKLDDVDGGTDSHTNKVPDQSKTFTLTVDVTAYKLTETEIKVKDGSKTLNVDKTADRGTAEYKSHKDKNIDPLDKLTMKWFYADTDPQKRALTAEEIAGINNETTPTYPTGWTILDSNVVGEFTGPKTGDTYAGIPNYAGKGNDEIKGRYVFAVATATSTGTGSVITNAIPVDYEGHITVKKDDKTVEAADATGYSVWLWPADEATAFDATSSKAIATTYNATDKTFDTANSVLTGGKSYYVYVTTVEGGTAYQKVNGITITGTDNAKTVNYYGVRAVTTDLLHAGASHELGEDFTTKTAPDTQFAVKGGAANGETVTSGTGVVYGTTVTATPNKAWASDHDYKWNWSVQAQDNNPGGTNADPTLTYGTEGQASGAASKDYTVTETNWIGGQMEQRTYTVTGDLKSLSGTGKLDTATLTSGAHSFTGTIGNSKTAPATVTFTGVPRNVAGGAVGEHYTISATPGDATTIIGYKAPAATAAEWTANPVSNADKVTVSPAAYQNRFTIFVEATNKVLTVVDAHKTTPAYDAGSGTHDEDKAEASGTGNDAMTHTDTGVFRNYTWSEKTVTITNNGNTELEVTLKITKGAGDVYTGTQGTAGTLVDGEVTITGLDQLTGGKVKLDPGESKTFGLTTGGGLDAYDGDTYSFEFSSKDARTGHTSENGPTVTYNYKMVVEPVEITKVTAVKQATGEYKVTDFTIKEANGKDDLTVGTKTNNDTDPTSGDLIYTWYVAAWNDAVTLDKNTGEPKLGGVVLPVGQGTISDNGKTYTPTTADKGKALYLVVKGRPGSNAKSAAMTPNPEENDPVVLVPYQGVVQIHEDDVLMDNDTRAGDYVVELRREGAPEGTAAIPMQWDGDKDAFVTNGDVLWARDPDWAADSGTEPTAWEYEVWASRVPGDDKATLQNTGLVINVGNKDADHIVDYYKVLIGETDVTQGIYEGKLADLTAGGIFLTKATLTQPKPKAETTVDTLPVANNGFVQKGNDVTFTYDNWTKDYKMTWSGAISDATNNGPADVSVHRAYSAKETKAVETTLSLKTYPVRVTVTGTVGKVDVITMALGGNTFTTATTGGIVGIGSTGLAEVAIGSNPTFQLPKADGYITTATVTDTAVKSWSYTYGGAQTDGKTTPSITVNVKGIAGQDTYNINLLGDGYAMSVTDDVPTNVDDITGATSVTATSSIPDGADATVQNNGATQTIHLNYNYARLDDPDTEKPQKVILTLKNEGNDDSRTIKDLTVNPLDATNITAGTLGKTQLAPGESTTLELTIDPDEAVGSTIHYKAEFSFTSTGTPEKTAKVTYELTVVIDTLPFTAVSTKAGTTEGTHTVNEYTVQPAPEGADAVKDTTISPAGADKKTGLTYDTDYAYKWVRTAMDVDLTNADVTWSNGTVTLPGTATDCTGTGHDKPTYTPDDAGEGQKLYLVVYAKAGTVNATGAAISPAITTGYTGTIQIKEDATDPVTGTTDPGYKVQFIPAGGGAAIDGVWNGKTDNTAGYSATLDPNVASYTVEVSRAKGPAWQTADHMVTLTGVTITNDHRTDKATYYTVSSKPFAPKAYQDGTKDTGETFQNADKAVTMTLEGKELTTGTPVLANQTVKAKSTNGWDQDYKLFWQTDKVGTNVSITTDTVDTTKQQDRDTAKGANAFSKQITDTTWIGGRLDQNTYEVTGHIRNKTGKSGGVVSKVEMVGGSNNRTYTTDTTNASAISANNSISVGSDGVQGNAGDTVKITVVKGEYTITAYEGTNTVITEVTIGADGVVTTEKNPNNPVTWANRNTAAMAGDDEKVAQAGRVFNIYLEGQALSLSVEDGHTDHEATSTTLDNNNQAKHTQVYYFNGVDTTAIPLTLTNGSNRQMTVTGAVTKVTSLTGVDFDAGTGLGSALGAGDKVTVTGVPTTGEVIAAGGTASGGSLSVAADAANTDDGIYIFQFTSSGTDTSGNLITGPTVYYVFDLTVEPLPIVEVDAAQDATTKVMSLVNATGAAGGLDHVRVDDDGKAGTIPVAADTKGLTDNDVKFVWYVSESADLDKTSFQLTAGGNDVEPKAGVTATKKADGKTCTPTAAEEGKFFYLIAYQKDTDCNASDFAVSDAIYAQVTVSVKAYQTNTTPQVQVPVTDDFNVVGTLGEGEDAIVRKAQDGQFAVNGNDPKKISFVATQADNADPAKAAWYFIGWGDTTGNFSSTTDLTTEYTVTKQDTVIGYYDQLPVLEKDKGYSLVESDEELNRTFTYHPYNGSKNVVVAIAPKAGSSFKSDPTAELMWLNADTWEKVASTVGGTIGEDGSYVLKSDWITTNLQLTGLVAGEYTITFYDLDKGEYKVDGGKPVLKGDGTGYAGYDRTITFKVTGGEVEVDARVKNDAPEGSTAEYHGTVTMTNGAGASNGPGTTASLRTSGGSVTITATPADGYEFAGWELITGTGKITETATGVADFEPYEMGCVVEASFKAGTLSMEDQTAKVIYGNQQFEGTAPAMSANSTATGESFTYSFVDAADLAAAGITDADATDAPGWLKLNADGTFRFNSAVDTNVESSDANTYTAVTNELVVYVKATATETGVTTIAKVTIDVEPGELTINGEAFNVPADALGGQSVDMTQFTYTSVTDQASTNVVIAPMDVTGDHTEKGKWSVSPKSYVGNDRENADDKSSYTFTFTYGPADDTAGAEKWNYKPTDVTLEFHVDKPPQTIYIADHIKNGQMVVAGTHEYPADDTAMTGKNSDVPVDLKYDPTTRRLGESITYLDTEPTYTVKIKGEGNLYGMSLTRAELTGFAYAAGTAPTVEPTWADDDTLEFDLGLTAISGKVWVGDHTATIEVTGYSEPDEDNWTDATKITATYELSIKVEPKVIDKLVVTVDPPVDGEKPDTDPDIKNPDFDEPDLEKPDRNGNKPIPTVTVTWEDEDGNPVDPDTPFTEGNYKVTVEVTPDPNYVTPDDITEPKKTTLNGKGKDDPTTDVTKTDPTVTITQELQVPGPIGVTFGGFKQTDIGKTVEEYAPASKNEEKYPLASPDYNTGWYWATKDDPDTPLPGDTKLEGGKTYVLTVKLDPNEAYAFIPFVEGNTDLATFNNVALTDVASLAGLDAGVLDVDADGNYTLRYHFTVPSNNPPPPPPECPYQVFYWLGLNGTTDDSTIEAVSEGGKPAHVPEVTAIEGYKFLGWSLTRPEEGKEVTLVDPTAERVTEDTTFYAVYEKIGPVTARHKNYIKGFPDGNFWPEKDITRAQVAAIIARAILPGYVEKENYGNIGGYTDVTGHWAASAIAYCSKYGVFKGYDDGTFQPNRSISRQELALVVARLDGVSPAGEIPFTDADQVSAWARDGVYTAYTKGLIRGYDDKTFRPLDNISREEAVTIFNRYLKRGVNAEGLADLTPYVKGEAKGEEGKSYMVWPDVSEKRWSYYDVIEASNDHEFYYVDETNETPPEHWTGCWIDGNWDDGSVDSIHPAAGAAETPKTSVPTQGTEALGILAAEPNTWAGPILPPLWVSKEMEVQF